MLNAGKTIPSHILSLLGMDGDKTNPIDRTGPLIEVFIENGRPTLSRTLVALSSETIFDLKAPGWHLHLYDTVFGAQTAADTLTAIDPAFRPDYCAGLRGEGILLERSPRKPEEYPIVLHDHRVTIGDEGRSPFLASWEITRSEFLRRKEILVETDSIRRDERISLVERIAAVAFRSGVSMRSFQKRLSMFSHADIPVDSLNVEAVKDLIEDMSPGLDMTLPEDRRIHAMIIEEISRTPLVSGGIAERIAWKVMAEGCNKDSPVMESGKNRDLDCV